MELRVKKYWVGGITGVAWALAMACGVLFLAGCGTTGGGAGGGGGGGGATPPEVQPGPEVEPPRGPVYGEDRLYPGTRITIAFSGVRNAPEPHPEQIRDDGLITPPMLNPAEPVKAAGLTIAELQQELYRRYIPSLFKNITITVRLDERYFFVGGEVRSPGQKPYLSEMTLLRAIQAAGDFNEYANKSNVIIIRTDGRREEVDARLAQRDPSKDPKIFPGDRITVSRYMWPI